MNNGKLLKYKDVFFVHYQCGEFNSGDDRIFNLSVDHKGQTTVFDARAHGEVASIENYWKLIKDLMKTGLSLIHWNQNAFYFGPRHLMDRYKFLTGKEIEIEYNGFCLSNYMWEKYGNKYIGHPRLDKLAILNNFLGISETDSEKRTYPADRVRLLTKIYGCELEGTLLTKLDNPPSEYISNTQSKYIELKEIFLKNGFNELDMVSRLSKDKVEDLIRLIVHQNLPYQIAFFSYLGFLSELQKSFGGTKKRTYEHLADVLGSPQRTIKGNINVLNEYSKEDRDRYTSRNYIEKVKNDYQSLKEGVLLPFCP